MENAETKLPEDDNKLAKAIILCEAAELGLALAKSPEVPASSSSSLEEFVKQSPEAPARSGKKENRGQLVLAGFRALYARMTERESVPKRPLVGRMVHVLTAPSPSTKSSATNHCSASGVFRLLLEKYRHLIIEMVPERYIGSTPRRSSGCSTAVEYHTDMDPGRRNVNNRLTTLTKDGYCQPSHKNKVGKADGYQLTELGEVLFDGWPELHP